MRELEKPGIVRPAPTNRRGSLRDLSREGKILCISSAACKEISLALVRMSAGVVYSRYVFELGRYVEAAWDEPWETDDDFVHE